MKKLELDSEKHTCFGVFYDNDTVHIIFNNHLCHIQTNPCSLLGVFGRKVRLEDTL